MENQIPIPIEEYPFLENYAFIIMYISIFSVLIPLVVYLSRKKIKQPLAIRELVVLLVISGLSDLTGFLLIKLGHTTNMWVTNSYFLFSYFIFSVVYFKLYLKKSPRLVYGMTILFFAFEIYNTAYHQGFMVQQSWTWTAVALVMLIFSIGFYRHIIRDDKFFIKLQHYTPYWINTGVFIYFGFSIWLFLVDNFIMTKEAKDVDLLIWSYHNVNNIIRNTFFAIAMYYAGKEPKSLLEERPFKKGYFDE